MMLLMSPLPLFSDPGLADVLARERAARTGGPAFRGWLPLWTWRSVLIAALAGALAGLVSAAWYGATQRSEAPRPPQHVAAPQYVAGPHGLGCGPFGRA